MLRNKSLILSRLVLAAGLCTVLASTQRGSHPDQSTDQFARESEKTLTDRAKQLAEVGKALEKEGKLAEAMEKYMEAEGVIATRQGALGISRINEKYRKEANKLVMRAKKLWTSGKQEEAIAALKEAREIAPRNPLAAYDLAVCLRDAGKTHEAASYLEEAAQLVVAQDERRKLQDLHSSMVAGENPLRLTGPALDTLKEVDRHISENSQEGVCELLESLRASADKSATLSFDLATCAEQRGNYQEAKLLLEQYLALAPEATDKEEVQQRVAVYASFLSGEHPQPQEVQRLHGNASRLLREGGVGPALAELRKANEVAAGHPQTKWRLALIREALGDVEEAVRLFNEYLALDISPQREELARYHLKSLSSWKRQYDDSLSEARRMLVPMLKGYLVDGRSVSHIHAQEVFRRAGEKLRPALAVFPYAWEANSLAGFISLQSNHYEGARRSFDAVTACGRPAEIYAVVQLKWLNTFRTAKIECSGERFRILYLGWITPATVYQDRVTRSTVWSRSGDRIGYLAAEIPRDLEIPEEDVLDIAMDSITGIRTEGDRVTVSLGETALGIRPAYLCGSIPKGGPVARQFANMYTRLLGRYLAYKDIVLGKESTNFLEAMNAMNASLAANMNPPNLRLFDQIRLTLWQMTLRQQMQEYYLGHVTQDRLMQRAVVERDLDLQGGYFRAIPSKNVQLVFRTNDFN